jgi:2'-5' RNA ligase
VVKRQLAAFVTVPADALVGDFRLRHQPRAVARRLPPHITVIPPFALAEADDGALAAALAAHLVAFPAFAAALVGVGAFERHVWLAPEPHEEFVTLLSATRRRFPQLIRDGARELVPHMTIAEVGKGHQSIRRVVQLAEEELAPRLPFHFEVRDVGLFEARSEGWHELRRFELG